jgi:hypothetical protein
MLKIFSIPIRERKEIAAGYRKDFAQQRDPALLNKIFTDFLVKQKCELPSYHTSTL